MPAVTGESTERPSPQFQNDRPPWLELPGVGAKFLAPCALGLPDEGPKFLAPCALGLADCGALMRPSPQSHSERPPWLELPGVGAKFLAPCALGLGVVFTEGGRLLRKVRTSIKVGSSDVTSSLDSRLGEVPPTSSSDWRCGAEVGWSAMTTGVASSIFTAVADRVLGCAPIAERAHSNL